MTKANVRKKPPKLPRLIRKHKAWKKYFMEQFNKSALYELLMEKRANDDQG